MLRRTFSHYVPRRVVQSSCFVAAAAPSFVFSSVNLSSSSFVSIPISVTSFRVCSSSTSTSTSCSSSDSTKQQQEEAAAAKPATAPPLTAEERAAFSAPPTVVTAKNFEQVVLQSQLAICLTYHVDNTRCRQFLPRVEEAVHELNVRSRTRWLSLMSIDADRNPSLAGAFSIERVKLPITFFVFSGTIVDKVNGAVPKERLGSILHRFMEYYQEQKGIELEDHGFMHAAKVETIRDFLCSKVRF